MSEEKYRVDVLQGWVSLEQKYTLENGRIVCRGHKKTFDKSGNMIEESEPTIISTAGYPDGTPVTKQEAAAWGVK